MTAAALTNIRVIDCSRVLAGPYCSMLLADYGADVIKIEEPGQGDGTRQWGPPWVGTESAYFLSVNRNKRSLTLNLKSDEGKAILRRLAADADVLIENFKPGTMARLGLDYERLRPANPGLIYCSISGFGQTGPLRDRPGYDFMIQAMGGIMSVSGPADGEPHKVGVAIVDITAGLYASTAILAALQHRERSGEGQFIDVALLDTQLAWLVNVAHNYFATGAAPGRYGNAHPNIVPYQSFRAADGHLALAVGSDVQFERFCGAINRPDLAADARFQRNEGRVQHRELLVTELAALFISRPVQSWLDVLVPAGIPVSPINDIPTIMNHPQTAAREMVQTVDHANAGPIQLLGPVAKLSATPAQIRSAPPVLGADSAAILSELGYSDLEIGDLVAAGVV